MATRYAFLTAHAALITIMLIFGAGLGTAALAQTAPQPAANTPTIDQLNSAAAAKDTVNDPRIAKSEATETGIWKSAVPPVKMKGAFDDHDPIGLAAGKMIPADCSINWTDPDTHKLYCFSSATSLVYFLYAPKANTARAEKGWRELKGTPTG
jgi:hypothetical protein